MTICVFCGEDDCEKVRTECCGEERPECQTLHAYVSRDEGWWVFCEPGHGCAPEEDYRMIERERREMEREEQIALIAREEREVLE